MFILDNAQKLGKDIFLTRFSVLIIIVVAFVLLMVPQGQETLRNLGEHEKFCTRLFFKLFCFAFSVGLWAVNGWYFSRVLLDVFVEEEHLGDKWSHGIPRFLGASAFIAVAMALHLSSYSYFVKISPSQLNLYFWIFSTPLFIIYFFKPDWMHKFIGALATVYTLIYLCICHCFAYNAYYPWHHLNQMALVILWMAFGFHWAIHWRKILIEKNKSPENSQKNEEVRKNFFVPTEMKGNTKFKDWSPSTKIFISILLTAHALFFLTILFCSGLPPFLGSATILIFGAATLMGCGTVLVFLGLRSGFPLLTLAFIASILFGYFNDNHAIREIKTLEKITKADDKILDKYLRNWLTGLIKNKPAHEKVPVFLVAAEGGGIRAAYWTASVLSGIQDSLSDFSKHTLALSGVSGGSLGSSVFAALLADKQQYPDSIRQCEDYDGRIKTNLLACSRAMLGEDYLSTSLAYMLYPDLIQRLLPLPIPYFDRARALEDSWEIAWRRIVHSDFFAQPLQQIWAKDTANEIPALLLNGTWVETGKRALASNLKLIPQDFPDAIDVEEIADHPLRLSTAVHLSARFTYVSPAGTLMHTLVNSDDTLKKAYKVFGHIVDGGYFENSGAASLYDVLSGIKEAQQKGNDEIWERIYPIVILIRFQQKKTFTEVPANKVLNELLSPAFTLLNTRESRGTYSQAAIKNLVEKFSEEAAEGGDPEIHYLEFVLEEREIPLPLGWTLSYTAKKEMDKQWREIMANSKEFGLLKKWLISN